MNVREIMKYIESEFIIINNTPCNLCGGRYITESSGFDFDNGMPSNITSCVCENCGNRKDFSFRAPLGSMNIQQEQKEMN